MSFTLFTTASGFQVSSNNNNVDLYKAAIHSAGEHLNTGCDQWSLTPIDFIIIAMSLVIKMLYKFISINRSKVANIVNSQ